MPVTTKCKHYRSKINPFVNQEIKPSRSSPEPQYLTIVWCDHEKSPLRENEKGVLECQGDVSKCPI